MRMPNPKGATTGLSEITIIMVLAMLTCNKLTWLGVGTMMDMIMWLMGSNQPCKPQG
jgi:hypothetical protein